MINLWVPPRSLPFFCLPFMFCASSVPSAPGLSLVVLSQDLPAGCKGGLQPYTQGYHEVVFCLLGLLPVGSLKVSVLTAGCHDSMVQCNSIL